MSNPYEEPTTQIEPTREPANEEKPISTVGYFVILWICIILFILFVACLRRYKRWADHHRINNRSENVSTVCRPVNNPPSFLINEGLPSYKDLLKSDRSRNQLTTEVSNESERNNINTSCSTIERSNEINVPPNVPPDAPPPSYQSSVLQGYASF